MNNGQSAVLLPDAVQRANAQAAFNRDMVMLRFNAAAGVLGHLMATEAQMAAMEAEKYSGDGEVEINVSRAVNASIAAADELLKRALGVKVNLGEGQ